MINTATSSAWTIASRAGRIVTARTAARATSAAVPAPPDRCRGCVRHGVSRRCLLPAGRCFDAWVFSLGAGAGQISEPLRDPGLVGRPGISRGANRSLDQSGPDTSWGRAAAAGGAAGRGAGGGRRAAGQAPACGGAWAGGWAWAGGRARRRGRQNRFLRCAVSRLRLPVLSRARSGPCPGFSAGWQRFAVTAHPQPACGPRAATGD